MTPDPDVGGRGQRPVGRLRAGLPDRDYPDFAVLTPGPGGVGVDYAIGEPTWSAAGSARGCCGPGWCGRVAASRDATAYFAAPDHRNAASLRVLEKVGFVRGLWFDEPQADGTTGTVVGCTLDVARVLG